MRQQKKRKELILEFLISTFPCAGTNSSRFTAWTEYSVYWKNLVPDPALAAQATLQICRDLGNSSLPFSLKCQKQGDAGKICFGKYTGKPIRECVWSLYFRTKTSRASAIRAEWKARGSHAHLPSFKQYHCVSGNKSLILQHALAQERYGPYELIPHTRALITKGKIRLTCCR